MSSKPVDTAIVMVVGPCIDDTDFKSLEESIAYNAAGMDVSMIVEKTDGTSAVTAITLTTGGTSDWTHKDGGYYEVEITAAQNAEEGITYLRGVCTGVLPFESPRYDVVKANIYDSLIKGTDKLETDMAQCGGSAVAAGAIPNAAADAAGGLPVSDAGNLDLDTKLANTNEITAARMGALTDWINGGRLDNLLDAIPTTAMRGTDNATLAATWTDARAGYLDNLSAGSVALAAGVDLTSIHGAALTETVNGYLAAAFTKLFDVATPLLVASEVMRGTDGANTTVPDAAGIAATPAEVATALSDIKLDHLLNIAVDTNWATTVHLDSVIGHMADVGAAATFDRTTDALEALRNRGDAAWISATGFSTHSASDIWSVGTRALTDKSDFGLSTASINLIWDDLISGITQVGSIGKLIADNLNATMASRAPSGEYDTQMGYIPSNLGDVPIKSELDSDHGAGSWATATGYNTVVPDVAGTAAGLHTTTNGKVDDVQTDSTAIKAKTDNLPSGIGKNEALPKFDFLMVLSSDHVTGAVAKTVTGTISKDGGVFAAITNVITEVSDGMYTIASGFTQTEMNADTVTLKFAADGCDTRVITIITS